MQNEPETLLSKVSKVPTGSTSLRVARLYLGYLALVLMCMAVSICALFMRVLLPRATNRALGRRLVASSFRTYLQLLSHMGACRFDLSELDALRGEAPVIVAPNHPSLLDALMILSRLPDACCIMKAELVNNVFFGVGARLVGYISNKPLRTMVQLSVDDLNRGCHLLLFPEGTRTDRPLVGNIQGTTGLISKRASIPVQTVFIETDSAFLGKGWSLLWAPKMPITYRIRLGKRFDPPEHTASFTRELQQYFQAELAHAQLPRFPAESPI
jgi:1-acyl-sn-glycerol-3-phosphate acyltransferase